MVSDFVEYMHHGIEIESNMHKQLGKLKGELINIICEKYDVEKEAIIGLDINIDCSTGKLLAFKPVPLDKKDTELRIRLNRMEETTGTFYNDCEKDHTFTRYIYHFDIDYD